MYAESFACSSALSVNLLSLTTYLYTDRANLQTRLAQAPFHLSFVFLLLRCQIVSTISKSTKQTHFISQWLSCLRDLISVKPAHFFPAQRDEHRKWLEKAANSLISFFHRYKITRTAHGDHLHRTFPHSSKSEYFGRILLTRYPKTSPIH
jgi:hypothetical protein